MVPMLYSSGMDPIQWCQCTGSCIYNLCVILGHAISSGSKRTRNWLLAPLRADERIYFVLKLLSIAFGTAFVWYFGWKGVQLARADLRATVQSNKLSAKQICLSGVRT